MNSQSISNQDSKSDSSGPIIILGALFFIFGFVTWLNSTLIQYLKIACELNNFQSLLVTFAFYISYFVMALPSSWILEKTGFRKGMMLGLIIMAIGAAIFIPAAMTRTYALFLTGLFIIGTGLSLLQTASNPYVTIIGPIESAASRISIMGICNKIAGVLGPIVLGAVLLSKGENIKKMLAVADATQKEQLLQDLASRAIIPYCLIALTLIFLAFLIRLTHLPEIEKEKDFEEGNQLSNIGFLNHPNLVYGVIALFLYVGVEVLSGDTIGNYGQTQGFTLDETKVFGSYTLAAMVIGYILGILTIPKYISQQRALARSAVLGCILTIISIATTGFTSVLCIALLGLANALVWPAIWPLALHGLGKNTKTGSAFLIMAIAGGALLPLLYGALADLPSIGSHLAYWIMLPCYLFILFYAVKGYKLE